MSKLDTDLQSCLEEMEAQGLTATECLHRHPDVAQALAPLLVTAERYRTAPPVPPSSAFRQAARTRLLNLMTTIERPGTQPRVTAPSGSWWRGRGPMGSLVRVGLTLAVLFALLGGTGLVAEAASPDSPAYPVKLALEEVRLALAWNEEQRAEVHLAIAERRAQELTALAATVSPEKLQQAAERYEAAVQAAVRHATKASSPPSITLPTQAALAAQERHLQETMAQMESAGPEARASLGRALGMLERERNELRIRLKEKEKEPPAGPPAGVPDPKGQRQQGLPFTGTPEVTPSTSVTSSPTATPEDGSPSGKPAGRPDQPGQGPFKEGRQ